MTGPVAATRPLVRGVQALTLLVVLAFVVTTVPGVRSGPRFVTAYDGWLQGSAYVLCALLAVLRPLTTAGRRQAWWLLAGALALRALGFVAFLSYVRTLSPPPYPSIADGLWLGSSVVLLVLVVVRVRSHAPRLTRTLLLDGVLAVLGTTAVAVALLYGPLVQLSSGRVPARAVVTNLVYPVLDVALVVGVVALMIAVQWRPRASEVLLTAGVLAFAIGDDAYLYAVSAGTYHPGTWIAALSLLATGAMALSAWLPEVEPSLSTTVPAARIGLVQSLFVPVAFALVGIAVLVYDEFTPVPLVAPLLAAGTIVVAIVRGITTIDQDRSESDEVIGVTTEELLRFRALVEASSDFIAIATTDASLLYVNPAGRRMVGLADDVDVGTTKLSDYLSPESLRHAQEVRLPAIRAQGHWEGEATLGDGVTHPPIPVISSSFQLRSPRTGQVSGMATIQRDISERHRAEKALQELADQRQRLLSRLVQAQEDERARIAADVHDDSVQALAAVELRLSSLRRHAGDSAPDLVETLDKALATTQEATTRLRHLLFDLESPALRADLASALGEAAQFVLEDSGVEWQLTGDRSVDLPEGARVTAYRVAKEALANVRAHSGADHVEINLARADGGVVVIVRDDGRGIGEVELEAVSTRTSRPGHLGLVSMHDRVTVAGGRLSLGPVADGTGTEVQLWLPDPGAGESSDSRDPG